MQSLDGRKTSDYICQRCIGSFGFLNKVDPRASKWFKKRRILAVFL